MKYYTIYDALNQEPVACSCEETVFRSHDGEQDFICTNCNDIIDSELEMIEPVFRQVEKPKDDDE